MLTVLNKLSFKARLLALTVMFLMAIVVVSGIAILNLKDRIMQERELKTLSVMDIAFGVLGYYHGQVAAGDMDERSAKETAIAHLRGLRYDKRTTFLAVDISGMFLLNPGFEATEGTRRLDLADAKGKPATRTLIDTAQSGGGFNSYWFARQDGSAPVEQITYSREFAPWGWVLGTSMAIDDINRDLVQQAMWLLAISAAMFLGALAMAWVVHRSLAATLGAEPSEAARIARELADGNLAVNVSVSSGDRSSLFFSMQQVKEGLLSAVFKIQMASAAIASAMREMAMGNNDLAVRTEAQAASLEQTAASVAEIAQTVQRNANSATHASTLATGADRIAVDGNQKVQELVATIGDIKKSSSRIAEITGLIDEIAFQTNILALNAAVEAARAGELGRGFAVVAGEVRALAQKSSTAAKEIKELVGASTHLVAGCVSKAVDAGTTMGELKQRIAEVSTIVSTIAIASDEQSNSLQQVSQAVAQMDGATQQNAALVEQAAAVASALQDQAADLQRAVGAFKVGIAA